MMPDYEITSPEGKKYRITAPEGASQADIMAYAQKSLGQTNAGPSGNTLSTGEKSGELGKLDYIAGTIGNIPGSALNFGKSMVEPIMHPIETAKNVGKLALGAVDKTGLFPSTGNEASADAVGAFFKERYGGLENIKKTIHDDPVGFAADLSTVLMPEGALARAPGAVGKIGEVARTASKYTNPVTLAAEGAKAVPKIAGQVIGNIGTGSGAEGLKGAFEAGVQGGKAGEAFRGNMRDPEAHQGEIVAQARKALQGVRQDRAQAYKQGMAAIGQSPVVLDFQDIDKAVSQASTIKSYKGIDISPSTAKVRKQINDAITKWKALDPAEYHTAAGMDALKQMVGDIKDSLEFNTPERKVAEDVYGAIRNTIVKQDPQYSKVMKDYEQASTLLDELTKTLSLGKKATEDTALRKLLSTTRSGVQANFGRRAELAKELGKQDPTLVPALAGQSVSTWTPQGLVGKTLAGGGGLAAIYGHNPALALGLPFSSPRVMGEAAHGAGRAVGAIPQEIKDMVGKVNPDVLKQIMLLMSRGGQQ